jgi:nitrite reductase/ring-hydroxylating ferredoxin subunit
MRQPADFADDGWQTTEAMMTAPAGYVWVMQADEVDEEVIYPFAVDGEERILVRVGDSFFALDGICTHEYAELAEGELEGETIWCPLHSSGFNVRNGAVTNLPAAIPLTIYDVQVEDGALYVSREPKSADQS